MFFCKNKKYYALTCAHVAVDELFVDNVLFHDTCRVMLVDMETNFVNLSYFYDDFRELLQNGYFSEPIQDWF